MKREIQIALLAIITLAASIWGFNFISGKSLFSGDKTYYAIFENVKDVNSATPILINGLQVGSVVSIDPEPEDISQIKVGFQVNKTIKLPDYTVVELRSSSPLGGREIELVFDKMCNGENCAPANSILEGKIVGLLGSLISTDEIGPHVESISSSIKTTLDELGKPDSEAAVDVAIYNLSRTMKNLASTTENLDKLMAQSSRNLQTTLANMATLTNSLVKSNEKLSSILANVDVMSKDMAKVSFSETMDKTNNTIDQAQLSLSSLESAMNEATATLGELNKVIQKLDNDDGTLGQLLNNDQLYHNIESSTRNLDLLLQDLRLNPRRYFKLFGKKVPDYNYPKIDPAENPVQDK